MKPQLKLFCREPEPGMVKTRLAADAGDYPACALYDLFLHLAVCEFDSSDIWDFVLCFTPPDAHSFFDAEFRGKKTEPQCDGDLGTRMASTIERSFKSGVDKAIIIGSDSPSLRSDYISNALYLLDNTPAVFGPAEDGGYLLAGVNREIEKSFAGLFQNIEWGTERVMKDTITRAESLGVDFTLLPPGSDVDTIHDLPPLLEYIDQQFTELRAASDLGSDKRMELLREMRSLINDILSGCAT